METELDGLENCPLHRRTPFGIRGVSTTQLSIARYYGMINFNGCLYIYFPATDELIRDDVLGWKRKQAKAAKTKASQEPTEQQTELNYGKPE